MPEDRRIPVNTAKGETIFHLTSHTISRGLERGHGAFHVQVFIPDDIAPRTATVFQAANEEFRICPSKSKAFRFKKDKHGVYAYVIGGGKLEALESRSAGHISLLVIHYQDTMKHFQRGA